MTGATADEETDQTDERWTAHDSSLNGLWGPPKLRAPGGRV